MVRILAIWIVVIAGILGAFHSQYAPLGGFCLTIAAGVLLWLWGRVFLPIVWIVLGILPLPIFPIWGIASLVQILLATLLLVKSGLIFTSHVRGQVRKWGLSWGFGGLWSLAMALDPAYGTARPVVIGLLLLLLVVWSPIGSSCVSWFEQIAIQRTLTRWLQHPPPIPTPFGSIVAVMDRSRVRDLDVRPPLQADLLCRWGVPYQPHLWQRQLHQNAKAIWQTLGQFLPDGKRSSCPEVTPTLPDAAHITPDQVALETWYVYQVLLRVNRLELISERVPRRTVGQGQ